MAEQSVPEGWQLVPKVPTPEMMSEHDALLMRGVSRGHYDIWNAMLSAAPKAPQGDDKRLTESDALLYLQLTDAMGYDSGKDGIEFSPEEWAAALLLDAQRWRYALANGMPRHCPAGFYYQDGRCYTTTSEAIDAATRGQK